MSPEEKFEAKQNLMIAKVALIPELRQAALSPEKSHEWYAGRCRGFRTVFHCDHYRGKIVVLMPLVDGKLTYSVIAQNEFDESLKLAVVDSVDAVIFRIGQAYEFLNTCHQNRELQNAELESA